MEIHIGDRVADVTLVSKEGNKVQFMIDGKPYDVDIVMAENGSCSILHDGNSFNAVECNAAILICKQCLVHTLKAHALALCTWSFLSQVINTKDHILRRNCYRTSIRRL